MAALVWSLNTSHAPTPKSEFRAAASVVVGREQFFGWRGCRHRFSSHRRHHFVQHLPICAARIIHCLGSSCSFIWHFIVFAPGSTPDKWVWLGVRSPFATKQKRKGVWSGVFLRGILGSFLSSRGCGVASLRCALYSCVDSSPKLLNRVEKVKKEDLELL